MPSEILDRLQRILVFADKVANDIVGEETEILEKTIPKMFEVMQKVANFSCDYVKRGRFGRLLSPCGICPVLMIAERMVGGLVRPEKIEEMGRELDKVIEDFGHAVNVETLYLAKKNGTHSISRSDYVSFSVVLCRATALGHAAETSRNRP